MNSRPRTAGYPGFPVETPILNTVQFGFWGIAGRGRPGSPGFPVENPILNTVQFGFWGIAGRGRPGFPGFPVETPILNTVQFGYWNLSSHRGNGKFHVAGSRFYHRHHRGTVRSVRLGLDSFPGGKLRTLMGERWSLVLTGLGTAALAGHRFLTCFGVSLFLRRGRAFLRGSFNPLGKFPRSLQLFLLL